jgi:pre-mRNA-processing factor SLU7
MSTTADNFKKRQEEAKKKQSGELPPDLDQDGKMINPHNPDFITKVPWYLGDSGPTLKHHNVQKVDHFLSLSEADELIRSKLATKKELQKQKAVTYRKGACKNCGSMTHKEKDCVERPRSSKKAAWKSGITTYL